MKTIRAKNFYALICDDRKYRSRGVRHDPMLCGVFSSKKEAQNCAKELKDCLCDHYIKKVSVVVKWK